MPGKTARYAYGSKILPATRRQVGRGTRGQEQAEPRRRQTKTYTLVLQPPREEGRVLLLEEERRPRFTRFDDAVFESRQPRL